MDGPLSMRDRDLKARVMLDLSAQGYTLFRNNTGRVKVDGRWVKFGLTVGSSDLIGWKVYTMYRQAQAIFTAIECKSIKDRVSPDQERFLANVILAGGIAMVAREQKDGSIRYEDWRK